MPHDPRPNSKLWCIFFIYSSNIVTSVLINLARKQGSRLETGRKWWAKQGGKWGGREAACLLRDDTNLTHLSCHRRYHMTDVTNLLFVRLFCHRVSLSKILPACRCASNCVQIGIYVPNLPRIYSTVLWEHLGAGNTPMVEETPQNTPPVHTRVTIILNKIY